MLETNALSQSREQIRDDFTHHEGSDYRTLSSDIVQSQIISAFQYKSTHTISSLIVSTGLNSSDIEDGVDSLLLDERIKIIFDIDASKKLSIYSLA